MRRKVLSSRRPNDGRRHANKTVHDPNKAIFLQQHTNTMKLRRFLLRYYPPGVILEYERRDGSRNTKILDLLTLGPE